MNYWLVKSEPFKYAWERFEQDGQTFWDGVRNYQARNNLMAMKKDDLVLFYHSNEGMEVVGIAKVVREHYPDPTSEDQRWVAVDLAPFQKFKKAVGLAVIKTKPELAQIGLIRQGRLSVMPLKVEEFDSIVGMGME